MENVKKPIRKITGWHLKKEFIDATGEVYSMGKLTELKVDQTEEDLKWLEENGYDSNGTPVGSVVYNAVNPSDKIEYNPEPTLKKANKEKELEERVEQLQSIVNKFLAEQKPSEGIIINAKEQEKFGTVRTKDIPPDDYEETEAVFIHRGRGTILSVYPIQGGFSYSPYNMPLIFVYHHTEAHRSGKMVDHNYYALYKTHSKAEKEWIRKSPYYNITIFEKVTDAVKYDMATSIKMANLSTWVESLKPDQIYGEAAKRSIAITDKSMQELKMAIMFARFDELAQDDNRKNEQRVANMQGLFKK